jgi:hypothetical protein
MEARLTPSVLAMAATVDCPERYISRATWALCPLSTEGAAVAAAGPGGGQPGAGAFADQVAFELGQGREDMKDELAGGGGGVDRLLEAAEPDPALSQPRDGVDQMPQGAAEPIEPPPPELLLLLD